MRRLNVIKCFSGLVAIVYILGVMGFNVHSCMTSGELFVSPLIEGATCHDLHPGHDCHSGCCHGHEGEDCCAHCSGENVISSQDCCSDNPVYLNITGIDRGEDGHSNHHHCLCLCGHCPISVEIGSVIREICSEDNLVPLPDRNPHIPGEIRPLLNVWRL